MKKTTTATTTTQPTVQLRPYLTRLGADVLELNWRNVAPGLQCANDGTEYVEVGLSNLATHRTFQIAIARNGAIYTRRYGRKEQRMFDQMAAEGLVEWDAEERVFEEMEIELW